MTERANVPAKIIRPAGRNVKAAASPAGGGAGFLVSLWHWEEGERWEVFALRGPAGDWKLRRGEELGGVMTEVESTIGNWYFSPYAYLPRGGRTAENIVQINAVVIDLDDGDLEEAETRLRERGLKPHYVVHTSPGHYQLIFLQEPIRLGKRNREAVLRRHGEVMRKLYELVGGDMAAATVNQMFRLPGSWRQLEDGVWTVGIIEQSSHPPYSLKRLEQAVAGTHKRLRSQTFKGYRPAAAEDRREGKNGRRVLSSPALQWLQSHTIQKGFRNTALVAMTYAAAMDGLSYEEAKPRLLQWVEEHTEGPYPRREAEAVIRSCYTNPKGLDPKILATIQDVNGKTMTEERAKSVLKFMPRTRQVHQRLPLEELRNRPLFESLMRVLKALAELQLKRSDRRPVKITTAELAERADVPPGTLWMRVIPILDKLKIRRVERQGKTPISTYDLRKLSPTFYIPYAFIDSKLFKRSP
ncbi:TPA: hypothetical protein EYP12_04190, partial [Candidatus Bipolaricaulota bacterium]|nr:hypothetical protein [Candidatus Bipolaricaulota bacterium]